MVGFEPIASASEPCCPADFVPWEPLDSLTTVSEIAKIYATKKN